MLLIIILLPLIGFIINTFSRGKLPPKIAGIIASLSVGLSFLVGIVAFIQLVSNTYQPITYIPFHWITIGKFSIPFGFTFDVLSANMCLIVTGIGFLIHLYSTVYMKGDERENAFFSNLNLFIFFMLLLILGNNFLLMFVGWEGVGLCSYLLIGHWFKNNSYNYAARKAFIMNRIGDLGFLIGIFLIAYRFNTLTFTEVFNLTKSIESGDSLLTIATMFLLVGALGKSAQIPLFTWLPDAMAGPTPVSALIHAATMVTAGIYMIARNSALFVLSPLTMNVIVIIGISTAFLAAVIGLKQNDIKKVLAYSTVSQLGYMFVALGVGAFTTGIFHVTTHSFFKALLFLGAGSVIHALHHEQDIRNMGGLQRKLPWTYFTFLIATLAISGIPPFSGFFSKDEILANAWHYSPVLWGMCVITAVFTAFYMFRLLFLVFWGEFRGKTEKYEHAHENKTMNLVLGILAILSFAGGFLNIPHIFGGSSNFTNFLSKSVFFKEIEVEISLEWILMGITLILVIGSIFYARVIYVTEKRIPLPETAERKRLVLLIYKKFYIDEIYSIIFEKPYSTISSFLNNKGEIAVDTGIVKSSSGIINWLGEKYALLQNGQISLYLFAMALGMLVLLVWGVLLK